MMMPNSFRKRIKKLAFLGYISGEETREIIQALNKQRPMKPKMSFERVDYDGYYSYKLKDLVCESCNQNIEDDNYCRHCGQKLKETES